MNEDEMLFLLLLVSLTVIGWILKVDRGPRKSKFKGPKATVPPEVHASDQIKRQKSVHNDHIPPLGHREYPDQDQFHS